MRGDKWICNLAQMIDYANQVRADNTVCRYTSQFRANARLYE